MKFNTDVDKVNIYNIFGYCYGLDPAENRASPNDMGFSVVNGQLKTYRKAYTADDYTPWATHAKLKKAQGLKETPPCVAGDFITDYMNKADVRAALHIPDKLPGWQMCNSYDWFQYEMLKIGSQWIYESLRGKMRMLHFTGDIDGAVPSEGTYAWIQEMNPEVIEDLRPYMFNDHVAGMVAEYDGLTYATVHGAGHMVPEDKPPEAYYLITNWIKGNRL